MILDSPILLLTAINRMTTPFNVPFCVSCYLLPILVGIIFSIFWLSNPSLSLINTLVFTDFLNLYRVTVDGCVSRDSRTAEESSQRGSITAAKRRDRPYGLHSFGNWTLACYHVQFCRLSQTNTKIPIPYVTMRLNFKTDPDFPININTEA